MARCGAADEEGGDVGPAGATDLGRGTRSRGEGRVADDPNEERVLGLRRRHHHPCRHVLGGLRHGGPRWTGSDHRPVEANEPARDGRSFRTVLLRRVAGGREDRAGVAVLVGHVAIELAGGRHRRGVGRVLHLPPLAVGPPTVEHQSRQRDEADQGDGEEDEHRPSVIARSSLHGCLQWACHVRVRVPVTVDPLAVTVTVRVDGSCPARVPSCALHPAMTHSQVRAVQLPVGSRPRCACVFGVVRSVGEPGRTAVAGGHGDRRERRRRVRLLRVTRIVTVASIRAGRCASPKPTVGTDREAGQGADRGRADDEGDRGAGRSAGVGDDVVGLGRPRALAHGEGEGEGVPAGGTIVWGPA